MRQVTTILVSVFVIVYLTLRIYQKPNYEFFLADNRLPNPPQFVRSSYLNGGINVNWSHPRTGATVTHYEIYVEDIREPTNVIPTFIVNDQTQAQNPQFVIRHPNIVSEKQYRISMKSVNNNGKSIQSNMGQNYNQFTRVAIGIGRPESRDPAQVASYVLSKFN